MSTSNFYLKLNQPKELPAEGVTSVSFKPWKNHLKNFLQQDVNNYMFLQGGIYSTWRPATESADGKRIQALHEDDTEKKAVPGGLGDEETANSNNHNAKLLLTRNSQLGKMIQHIVSFVHYTEADDIDQSSASVEWIFDYLMKHYNIETKGANFLKITDHVYTVGTQPQVFYKQFRASFLNNLRKSGEVMTHKGGKVMTEDEGLSPSFEDAIVLWTLEKIDPRLPKKVRKDYEHRLTGSTYLIDLQPSIFQSIPAMIEEMDKQADLNALTAKHTPPAGEAALSAMRPVGRGGSGPLRGGGRGGRGRTPGEYRPWSRLFCRVCHLAGKPDRVYQSHNTGDCGFFTNRDRKSIYTSLRAMNIEEEDDVEEEEAAWNTEDKVEMENDDGGSSA